LSNWKVRMTPHYYHRCFSTTMAITEILMHFSLNFEQVWP
jgi:hypothetical protein